LKGFYSKLDEQYKKQAVEISDLKHKSQELDLELKILSEKEDKLLKDKEDLKDKNESYEKEIAEKKDRIKQLKIKNENYEKFKNIDFDELTSIYQNNLKMTTFLDEFIGKFQNLNDKNYRDPS